MLALVAAAIVLGCLGCDGVPRDPERTLAHVEHGRLRVGVIDAPPWAEARGGDASGVEAELVRELAREIDARPIWITASPSDLFDALRRFQIDLVIGGVTADTPWAERVGLTSPYFDERICVGTPRHRPLEHLRAARVAVREGDAVSARLASEGVRVDPFPELSPALAPLAAPEFRLRGWHLDTVACPLTRRHVFATPPGENGWLMRVDRFLRGRGGEAGARLEASAGGGA